MKPAQVIVLCEDKQQEVFVRRFMKPRTNHPIRVVSAPVGEGAGEQFVREQYPQQLRALRAATVNVVLVVMIDGDTAGSVQRMRQLVESCRLSGITPWTDADRVIVLVPERNIETWLAYLGGDTVDETTGYPKLDRPSDCKTHVRVLADRVRLFFVEDFSPYSWALLPANASLQWPFRGGRHQAGQRVPASFRQPAEPRHGAEHLRSSPRQARSLLDIRAAFWYGAVGREADLRWL